VDRKPDDQYAVLGLGEQLASTTPVSRVVPAMSGPLVASS
jgi:hypothetical protein